MASSMFRLRRRMGAADPLSALAELQAARSNGAVRHESETLQPIAFCVVLSAEGDAVGLVDLRRGEPHRRSPRPVLLAVPAAVRRTSDIAPNFLWDKTSYAFGRTAKAATRTAREHEAFRSLHLSALAETRDPALVAFRRFVERWRPERFDAPPFSSLMLDRATVFALLGEPRFVHERAEARAIFARLRLGHGPHGECLLSGRRGAIARVHPVFSEFPGRNAPLALVSFHAPAHTSYGRVRGENAPIATELATAYADALRSLLRGTEGIRLDVLPGRASLLIWAEGPTTEEARALERTLGAFLRGRRERMDSGADTLPKASGATIRILGLTAMHGRLAVRFWFGDGAEDWFLRLRGAWRQLALEPSPWGAIPPAWPEMLARGFSAQGHADAVPSEPALAATEAFFASGRLPPGLFPVAEALFRKRRDLDASFASLGWPLAFLRGSLLADGIPEAALPAALREQESDPAYRLGRLCALLDAARQTVLDVDPDSVLRSRLLRLALTQPRLALPRVLTCLRTLARAFVQPSGAERLLRRPARAILGSGPLVPPPRLSATERVRLLLGFWHERFRERGEGGDGGGR